jgi:acyl-coenzyme A synthetase/AMP-(fatty) acid ligase
MATPKGRRAPDASIIGASRLASPRKRQIGWLADEAPMELFNRFERETGIRILKVYGMTEGGCFSTLNPATGVSKAGSIGIRLPWQRVLLMKLDADGGYVRDAAINEVGVCALPRCNSPR